MLLYDDAFSVPGQTSILENTEKSIWWGDVKRQVTKSVVVVSTATDAGNSPTDILRPGLIMGQVSGGKWTGWSATATDGSQYAGGVLLGELKINQNGTAVDRLFVILVAGNIKAGSLIVPGNSSYGINGDNNEIVLREQLSARFVFDDEPAWMPGEFRGVRNISTAAATLTEADHNTLITNSGATAAQTLTLPSPRAGYHVKYAAAANYAINLTGATTAQLYVTGGGTTSKTAASNSICFSQANQIFGNSFDIHGIGTQGYLIVPSEPLYMDNF